MLINKEIWKTINKLNEEIEEEVFHIEIEISTLKEKGYIKVWFDFKGNKDCSHNRIYKDGKSKFIK